MSSKRRSTTGSLNLMVGAAIVAWASTFAFVHGPFVFGYIAMHGATTGVFLLAIRRSDRVHDSGPATQPALAKSSAAIKRPAADRRARPQPVA